MSNEALPKEAIERLGKYDTPTVCNVIELFGVRPKNSGYMDRTIRACFPELPPMVGYASTATFRASASSGNDAYSSLEDHIAALTDLPFPPVIVFEDLDDPCAGATFGEIMCTTYKAFGAAGLITSGTGRDLAQVHALEFPVFTNGTVCSHGYCTIPSLNVPVNVGGITVQPGDLLHGDRDGVTTIPHDIASDIADACEEFARAESVVLECLKTDRPTEKGLREARGECRRIVGRLSLHYSRK